MKKYTIDEVEQMNFDDLKKAASALKVYKKGMKKPEMLTATMDFLKEDSKGKDESKNSDKKKSVAKQVRDLFDKGKTNVEIAEELGCTKKYAYEIIWAYEKKKDKDK